jgi:hypothetical protein
VPDAAAAAAQRWAAERRQARHRPGGS